MKSNIKELRFILVVTLLVTAIIVLGPWAVRRVEEIRQDVIEERKAKQVEAFFQGAAEAMREDTARRQADQVRRETPDTTQEIIDLSIRFYDEGMQKAQRIIDGNDPNVERDAAEIKARWKRAMDESK